MVKMLRNILESKLGPLSDSQLRELMDLVTTDIRTNNIAWNKRTTLADLIDISRITFKMLQRCRVA